MRKVVWVVMVAAIGSVSGATACSSSKSNPFPYSGPSCMGPEFSSACISCEENACPSAGVSTCVSSTCSSYFKCFCDCALGDTTCYGTCMTSETSACMTCLSQMSSTGTQCSASTTCSSQCSVTATSSSGGSGGSSGGTSTATGACASLMTCCAGIAGGGTATQECDMLANLNVQTDCQMALSAFEDAGVCH
jgi:hypothetical protein